MKIIALLLVSALSLAAADSYLLRGATVHTVSGADIPNGDVLIRDGKIADVGAKLAVRGAQIIDVRGLHVYPGLIDSLTEIGLSEIAAVRETDDTADLGDYNPQLRAIIAVNPASEHIPVTRANGVTSVIATPSGAVIAGQAALIRLDGWTWQEMAVLPSAALALDFPGVEMVPRGETRGPGSPERLKFADAKRDYDLRLQKLHEFFEQARHYKQAKAAAQPDFKTDLRLEAMLPALDGKLPVLVFAYRKRAIRDALAFAEKEKIRIILCGAMEAWEAAAEIKAKNTPVILTPTLSLPLEEDDPYDKPYAAPGELHKAGVKFAFGSFGNQFARNLPYQASMAAAFGLPRQEALKAVTLNAAEIWGVGDKLGSIEKGKAADLIVTDGDPLETRTQVLREFIAGKPVDLDNKHRRLYEKYSKRP